MIIEKLFSKIFRLSKIFLITSLFLFIGARDAQSTALCWCEEQCNIGWSGCEGGATKERVVPLNMVCTYFGGINNTHGVAVDQLLLEIAGPGQDCVATVPYEDNPDCIDTPFEVTCVGQPGASQAERTVIFSANDSSRIEIYQECEPLCVENMGEPCTVEEPVGVGECANTEGIVQCDGSCLVVPGEPTVDEICGNQLDDNCNGEVDENNAPDFGETCTVGEGICENSGLVDCTGACDAEPGEPLPCEICNDLLDNDCDGIVDNDDQCPLITITASDGEFEEYVRVEWDFEECAATYTLYRSEVEADILVGAPFQIGLTDVVFLDTFAVPGVVYYYHAIAINEGGVECNASNVDPGFRLAPFNDCDGDGVSDEQEQLDGTLECDPGSFQRQLKSPVYGKYNVFLSQLNYLELIADGEKALNAFVTVYDISGNVIAGQAVVLDPGEEFDVDINALVNKIDTYGIVRVDFNDDEEGVSLQGRMSNYRPDPSGDTFSFAFSKELLNAVKGHSFATANSVDPQGIGFLVPNWAEIINIEPFHQTFTYRLRNQAGDLIEEKIVQMPGLSERDVNAGHENGQGVYLAEVIPHNGAASYLMTVSRYSSNSFASDEAETYNFAFAIPARVGTADIQHVPITNEAGACYSVTNWVEVANTKDKVVSAMLKFRDSAGNMLDDMTFELQPYSQYHFNGSGLLPKGEEGSVAVTGTDAGAVIAQSVVYYHDCENNLTQTAYVVPGKIPGAQTQVGSYNRFAGIENRLSFFNATANSVDYTLETRSSGALLSTQQNTLGGSTTGLFNLNDASVFSTTTDTYGTVTLKTNVSRRLVGGVVRFREDPRAPGKADFAFHTPLN